VKAGYQGQTKRKATRRPSILDDATDWKLLVDFDTERIIFPPVIYATIQRPDIVIWSVETKQVIMIELTCPAEEGITAAQVRKEARYATLAEEIKSANQEWSTTVMTIEAGARGFVALSLLRCLKKLGLVPRQQQRIAEISHR
jgi:hypothetical protein